MINLDPAALAEKMRVTALETTEDLSTPEKTAFFMGNLLMTLYELRELIGTEKLIIGLELAIGDLQRAENKQ